MRRAASSTGRSPARPRGPARPRPCSRPRPSSGRARRVHRLDPPPERRAVVRLVGKKPCSAIEREWPRAASPSARAEAERTSPWLLRTGVHGDEHLALELGDVGDRLAGRRLSSRLVRGGCGSLPSASELPPSGEREERGQQATTPGHPDLLSADRSRRLESAGPGGIRRRARRLRAAAGAAASRRGSPGSRRRSGSRRARRGCRRAPRRSAPRSAPPAARAAPSGRRSPAGGSGSRSAGRR